MANLIYLDVDDEITSAAARIRATEMKRIGLVLPLGSRLATSRINFRLLAREAEARGKQLEVVTSDASARALAASAGLVTHVSVAAFEAGPLAVAAQPAPRTGEARATSTPPASLADSPTIAMPAVPMPAVPMPAVPMPAVPMRAIRPPVPVAPVPEVGRRTGAAAGGLSSRRLAAILALVALVVGAGTVGFLMLPSAEITLTATSDRIGPLHLSITAQPGITQPDPANLLVPATTFRFDVPVSDTFQSTGIKVDETAATGQVTFKNFNTGASNTIPKGAIVSTQDGVQFRTTGSLTLLPAQLVFGPGKTVVVQPSTGTVAIDAVAPGLSGNVAAGTITVVPPSENPVVTKVANDAPTTGGTHTETKEVAQADIDAASASLKDRLKATFDEKLAAATGIPAGTTVFAETKALGDPVFTPDPATLVGTVADTFQLGATATGTVVGVDPAPVSVLAEARLRTAVGDGFTLVEGSIDLRVEQPIVTGTSITFPVTVSAVRLRQLDQTSLRARIRGLGVPQARALLGAYGDVTITVWPDWVTTIPSNDSRVTFTVVAPSPGSSPGASPGPSLGISSTPSAPPGTTPVSSP